MNNYTAFFDKIHIMDLRTDKVTELESEIDKPFCITTKEVLEQWGGEPDHLVTRKEARKMVSILLAYQPEAVMKEIVGWIRENYSGSVVTQAKALQQSIEEIGGWNERGW